VAKPKSGTVSLPRTIREATEILYAAGFREVDFRGKRRKGRHNIWVHPDDPKHRCHIPRGADHKSISLGVAKTILVHTGHR